MELQNPNNGGGETKPKIVVIMGPTGSGKSKLAIDLATHFPVEIINADSMQVYHSLDVLTNKVTLSEQKGVPHHLLGTISPNVEFTAKDFRDAAIPIIKDIISRNHLPVIVGGTNFYIQALVSSFLLDDSVEEISDSCLREDSDVANLRKCELVEQGSCDYSYDRLRDLDPVAANRIHPNDHRKIRHYIELFTHSEILPSQLFQGEMTEKRRINRLQTLFGWNIHFVDSTDSLLGNSEDTWISQVIEPAAEVISSFLNSDVTSASDDTDHFVQKLNERDLWTQYTCKACDKILRGAHEWEQHNQGRGHRKRMANLKKRQGSFFTVSLQLPGGDCVSSDASQV